MGRAPRTSGSRSKKSRDLFRDAPLPDVGPRAMLVDLTEEKREPMIVELIMHVGRSQDNRLSGTGRSAEDEDTRRFSGMLELTRVFEEADSADPDVRPADRGNAVAATRRMAGTSGHDEHTTDSS